MNWDKYKKYFTKSEFACKCCGKEEMKEEFMDFLYACRSHSSVPFVITSGYRCAKHNKAVGGKPNSAHLTGYAADISCPNDSVTMTVMKSLLPEFNRIGIKKGMIHVDMDPTKPKDVLFQYV